MYSVAAMEREVCSGRGEELGETQVPTASETDCTKAAEDEEGEISNVLEHPVCGEV